MILVGLVNIAPVIGLVSVGQLNSMYGINIGDANLQILMLHRALMFGLLGGLVLYSAFRPAWQPVTMSLAFISMAGFIAIALLTAGYNEQLAGVMAIDAVALVLLLVALGLRLSISGRNRHS
jgi:hypothetical protein